MENPHWETSQQSRRASIRDMQRRKNSTSKPVMVRFVVFVRQLRRTRPGSHRGAAVRLPCFGNDPDLSVDQAEQVIHPKWVPGINILGPVSISRFCWLVVIKEKSSIMQAHISMGSFCAIVAEITPFWIQVQRFGIGIHRHDEPCLSRCKSVGAGQATLFFLLA